MKYINTQTGEYPCSELQVREAFPNVSFPVDFVPPIPFARVFPTSQPEYDRTLYKLVQGAPVVVDGNYCQAWEIVDLDPTERVEALLQKQHELETFVQNLLDSKARERGYDNILSACTYASSNVAKFRAEAQACIEWRDTTWSQCYSILSDVLTGVRPIPTREELQAELPLMVWPE